MTDTISGLSKWTKEKLVSEVMQLRNQRMESFNLANKNQDNNQELDRLKLELEHQRELYNQVQSEIQFLSQNDILISKLISEKTVEKDVVKSTVNRHFYPKFVPRFTKQLIISDSSYKLVRQNDISNDAAIHSYPSSTTKDLNNIIDNYAPSTKAECLIIHSGHNSIDKGTAGEDAAKELGDLFRLCPPSTLCSPQLQSTCHYIVNHYVKILHVHLGVANNMHPLSWGGTNGKDPSWESFYRSALIK